ncbi:MAG: HEAT repeat domain-containing protein [Anaerohalosphaeraceae bacterium]|nr:HEAT repeat domain-containing protein [Anaerohalosphaeraceae bacterium]
MLRMMFFGVIGVCVLSSVVFAESLEDDWGDFLHYTAIGRFDLASGFADKIIQNKPDPLELLRLSEENPRGYAILVRVSSNNAQLAPLAGKILDVIEEGRYMRRTDPKIIVEEIKRLSSTVRGRYTAISRLRNAGEYAIAYMLDTMADEQRKAEFSNITSALSEISRAAIRPLAASLSMDNIVVKAEVIKAMGQIGYPQSLGHLKYIVENDSSQSLKQLAVASINQIDSSATKKSAAKLFLELAENYYYKASSLAPAADFDYANLWFWEPESRRLIREDVSKDYFNELMTMRSCEWALRADQNAGKAIGLWIAAFFRAEGKGLVQPKYFGTGHADAMTYATTAGTEYLHQALQRGVKDGDAVVALAVVEALAKNAGEKSLMFSLKTSQPLIDSLSFDDMSVRYSSAIALGLAGPVEKFAESQLVAKNLAEAISQAASDSWPQEKADSYAIRAAEAMLKLAVSRNKVVDLSLAMAALIGATADEREEMQIYSGNILAYLESPDAQRAIGQMALAEKNSMAVRITAFESLAISAKINANLLLEGQIDSIYSIIESTETDSELRGAAAAAFGALNLPSRKVKDLILNQAKI